MTTTLFSARRGAVFLRAITRFVLGVLALLRFALTMALMLLAVTMIGMLSRQIGVFREIRAGMAGRRWALRGLRD
ncbi:MAG: hypothetical protein HC822_02370 [Oscillochloris sp.]|nr:hypothetical protein [Oscillochloris sp.]